MISIIMPTLWRGEYYKRMLPLLDDHPLVGEIFIINNNLPDTDEETLSKLNKLTHYKTHSNLYVNPSWNYGVKHSSFDKICLYSDDVLFDINCLESVYDVMTHDNGVTGFHANSIFIEEKLHYFSEWENKRISPANSMHFRFGICMFMHKNSYYPIPEKFKIWYGDTFLYNMNERSNKQNWWILNYHAVTWMSKTASAPEFETVLKLDKKQYKNYRYD